MAKDTTERQLEQEIREIVEVLVTGSERESAVKLLKAGKRPLTMAIFALGGKGKVAEMLGVSRQTLYNWLSEDGDFPSRKLLMIAERTKLPMELLVQTPAEFATSLRKSEADPSSDETMKHRGCPK